MKLLKLILKFLNRPKKTITYEQMIESQKALEEFKDMKAKALIGFPFVQ